MSGLNGRPWFIYALKDPRTDEIRYVGWALDVKRRLQAHLDRSTKSFTHKDRWIQKLKREGITPSVEILESGTTDDNKQAERAWIFRLRALGLDLTNTTDGGDGALGNVMSSEARAKIAAAQRNRPPDSPETTARRSEARKLLSPKVRAKIIAATIAANRGKIKTPETRAKISAALKGKTFSPERCAIISATSAHTRLTSDRVAALTASRQTPEARANMAQSQRGRKCSDETRAKIGAKSLGRKGTGRKKKPVECPFCGLIQASTEQAREHCRVSISARLRLRWQNPEWRAMMLPKVAAAREARVVRRMATALLVAE